MAYDEGLAQLIRDELSDRTVAERKMFGGLCFLVNGHMVAGVHPGGAMVRVGKANEDAAFAIDGTAPMTFTGRSMTGMVTALSDCMADDIRRRALIGMALAFVETLPPK